MRKKLRRESRSAGPGGVYPGTKGPTAGFSPPGEGARGSGRAGVGVGDSERLGKASVAEVSGRAGGCLARSASGNAGEAGAFAGVGAGVSGAGVGVVGLPLGRAGPGTGLSGVGAGLSGAGVGLPGAGKVFSGVGTGTAWARGDRCSPAAIQRIAAR